MWSAPWPLRAVGTLEQPVRRLLSPAYVCEVCNFVRVAGCHRPLWRHRGFRGGTLPRLAGHRAAVELPSLSVFNLHHSRLMILSCSLAEAALRKGSGRKLISACSRPPCPLSCSGCPRTRGTSHSLQESATCFHGIPLWCPIQGAKVSNVPFGGVDRLPK